MLEGNFDEQVLKHNEIFLFILNVKNNIVFMQLQTIFVALSAKKQTLLFSATITDTLNKLKEMALNNVNIT